MSNAVDGDTIYVTAGSAAWSSEITIKGQAISIIGGNGGTTTLTGGTFFYITSDKTNDVALRISNFTMISTVDSPTFQLDSDLGGQAPRGFRIDHIIREITPTASSSGWVSFATGWGTSTSSWKGLFDHNTITNGRIWWFGEESSTAGRYRWSEPTKLGTEDAVYIEDNTFIVTSPSKTGLMNQVDGNWGSRTVVRFNTFTGGRIEQHSLQGDNQRAVRMWEIYGNTFTSDPADKQYRPFFIRGGTGVIFDNTSDGNFTRNRIDIDNVRSIEPVPGLNVFGMCDGTKFVDGNESNLEGYLCRDQIGAGPDIKLWNNYSNPAPVQAKEPAYMWNNGQNLLVEVVCETVDQTLCTRQATKHLVQNRDWYTQNQAFDGTSGVGVGPIKSLPSSCTTGVAYWAVDAPKTNWRTNNGSGDDGGLYICVANTWSLEPRYVPYTYPHPLQN